jgi:MFS family permease
MPLGGKMKKDTVIVYKYRWVVLAVYALINAVEQVQWLTFAPIAREARAVYGVSALHIDFLSLIFMIVFLIVCVPASYIIDTYGIKIGVGIGAVLLGIFGLLKGLFPFDYTLVVVSQIGLAIAQPFILNSVTKVAGLWFPITERAIAVGIATLAQFTGIISVMIITPMMIEKTSSGSYDISSIMMAYGIASVISAILVLFFLKEKPLTPPEKNGEIERISAFKGYGHIVRNKDMRLMIFLFFIGLGIFNAISTCIDQICQAKGLTMEQTGMIGGIMLFAGIFGALILPALSDKFRKRKFFILLGMIFMTPGLLGLALATDYIVLLVSSFVFGFFLLGAGAPVGFQYCAEISLPAPESTSQGLILLVGQISGILFIVGMNVMGMIPSLYIFVGLAIITIILSSLLKESDKIQIAAQGS